METARSSRSLSRNSTVRPNKSLHKNWAGNSNENVWRVSTVEPTNSGTKRLISEAALIEHLLDHGIADGSNTISQPSPDGDLNGASQEKSAEEGMSGEEGSEEEESEEEKPEEEESEEEMPEQEESEEDEESEVDMPEGSQRRL
jgi:hypothetical protein